MGRIVDNAISNEGEVVSMKQYPKILICTVDCWKSDSAASTANTFANLFGDLPPQNLANIYIREDLPDSKVCSRYFQIAESRIIKNLFRRKTKTGREVSATTQLSQSDIEDAQKNKKIYDSNRKKRPYFKLFIRELIWKLSKWKTNELDEFVKSFAPDIVVFCMGGYIHFNRLCRHVIKIGNSNAIGFFWDDNFTYKQGNGIGFQLFRFFQRKSLKKTAKCCSAFCAITEKTKREADAFFGIQCKVLTKAVDYDKTDEAPQAIHAPIRMLYTGNLYIGRMSSIFAISKALEEINKDTEKVVLDIYTPTPFSDDERQKLCKSVCLHKPVSQETVLELQKKADMLLFVESLEKKYCRIARLSFSTKITDYLMAKKCIFAIGDRDTASMEYLDRNQLAVCVYSYHDIFNVLSTLIENKDVIREYAARSHLFGIQNHSREIIAKKRDEIIEEVTQGLLNDESSTD